MIQRLGRHNYPPGFWPRTLLLLLATFGCSHAFGQGASPESWHYEVTPYLWATAMKGDVKTGRLPKTSVDMQFTDILDTLDAGFMTAFEARKARWGFLLDGMYMKVSDSAQSRRGAVSVDATLQVKQSMLAAAVAYRVMEGKTPIDVIGGVRYNKIDASAKMDASLFGLSGRVKKSGETEWADPYVGVRATVPINEKWKAVAYIDAGGSSAGSDLTWQGLAGVSYAYSPSVAFNMGYRYMKVNYDHDGFKYNMANDGLYFAVAFQL